MHDKVFLFIDSIPGNCTDANHIGWIPINSVHFQVARTLEYKTHTQDIAPHSSSPTISQITIMKSTCMASPHIFQSLCQLQEHRFIIDVEHIKSSFAGENNFESAMEDAASTGSTRYEIAAGHLSTYEVHGEEGEVNERIIIESTALTVTYNPPLKSEDKKSSFGYNFRMLKSV